MLSAYATGLGYDGGTGNPGDVNGQYGWHVQVIAEAADHTWATVKIWNAAVIQTPTYTPHAITSAGTKTFTYTYRLENASSVTSTVAVTFTLDSHLTSASPADVSGAGVVSGPGHDAHRRGDGHGTLHHDIRPRGRRR